MGMLFLIFKGLIGKILRYCFSIFHLVNQKVIATWKKQLQVFGSLS